MLRILFRLAVLLFVLALAVALSDGGSGRAAAPQAGASFQGTIAYRYDYGNVEDEGEAIYALDASGRTELWSRHYGDQPGYTGNIDWSRGGELAFRIDEDIFAVGEGGGLPRQVIAGAEDSTYSDPSWSPSGDRLAVTHTGSIHVISSTNGTPMPGPIAQGSEPDWSPDGQKIVYRTGLALWITDPQGASASPLIEGLPQTPVRPSWSPNGQRIAFGGDGDSDLFVVGADGQGLVRITQTPNVEERDPEWSPDGTEIAYIRRAFGGPSQIYIVNVETGATRLVHDPGGVGRAHAISWLAPSLIHSLEITQGIQVAQSPSALKSSLAGPTALPQAAPNQDGRIAFSDGSNSQISGTIKTMKPDGSNLMTLHSGSSPRWSPDGTKIAFVEQEGGTGQTDIFLMNRNGSDVRQITNTAAWETHPTWSPDGSELGFYRGAQAGEQDIWVVRLDGGAERQITQQVRFATTGIGGSQITWSPDGTKLLFSAFRSQSPDEEGMDLFTARSAGGGQITNLTNTPANDDSESVEYNAAWSRSGNQIAFQWFNSEDTEVYLMNADGTGRHKLTALGLRGNVGIAWSPDGARIALGIQQGGTIIIDSSSGVVAQSLAQGQQWLDWGTSSEIISSLEITQGIQLAQSPSALAGGSPPVPIVAGKPAALRIYVRQLQPNEAGTYTFILSGQVNRSQQRVMSAGCTPEERRTQANNCKSVDFYFTPPENQWSITLKVRDAAGAELENHTFTINSTKADRVFLKAVGVCDSKLPSGAWNCQTPVSLYNLASLLRRIAPTPDVIVLYTSNQVHQDIANFLPPVRNDCTNSSGQTSDICWWGQVDRDLEAMHGPSDVIAGFETYYVGMVRSPLPGGTGTLGAAYVGTRGAAAQTSYTGFGFEVAPWFLAHEVGHAMGLNHITGLPALNAGSPPGCWAAATPGAWPYPDNKLRSLTFPGTIQVGFDVANQTAIPGDKYFDFMGYCASTPPPTALDATSWIAPWTIVNGLLDPAGPLSVNAAVPASVQSAAGDFWLVRGTIDEESGDAAMAPIFQLTTEGDSGSGSGSHRIEVQDGSGAPLFTRMFSPPEGHGSPSPGEEVQEAPVAFTEFIPVQAGAAAIVVLEGTDELARINIEGAGPAVEEVTIPDTTTGQQTVAWSVSDPDSTQHTYWVDYSADGGETWYNQAMGLTEPSLTLDFDSLAGSEGQAVFRIIASDGVNSGQATSAAFSVGKKAPHAEIIGPQGHSFHTGDLVWLEAAAWDVDDGTPAEDYIAWTSSRDGALGSGASLPVYDLSAGQHTITLTVHDSDGNSATDTVSISVSNAPIVEGEQPGTDRTWGDDNCDGNITLGDAIAVARFLVGLGVTQGDGCPPIGETVGVDGTDRTWGDLDCSGTASLGDAITLARFLVGIVPDIAGCPAVGSTVRVQT